MSLSQRLCQVVAVTLALAGLWPLLVPGRDNFPISSYPMFTSRREAVHLSSMAYVTANEALLQGTPVPPAWISGQEVMLALSTIAKAKAQGPQAMNRLCAHVQKEAASAGVRIRQLGYMLEHLNIDEYLSGQGEGQRELVYTCPLAQADA